MVPQDVFNQDDLRRFYASQAMQSLVTAQGGFGKPPNIATMAFDIADAMVAEEKKRNVEDDG